MDRGLRALARGACIKKCGHRIEHLRRRNGNIVASCRYAQDAQSRCRYDKSCMASVAVEPQVHCTTADAEKGWSCRPVRALRLRKVSRKFYLPYDVVFFMLRVLN
jgi:hypothetical protein